MSKYSLIMLALFLAGCNCTRYTYGYVVDLETREPLANVQIRSHAALDGRARDQRQIFTDSTGWFETAFELSGIAKCGNLKMEITYPDYETQYRVDMTAGDTIFLRKIIIE